MLGSTQRYAMRRAGNRIIVSPTLLVGLMLAGFFLFIAVFADIIASGSTSGIDIPNAFLSPSWEHIFGTDNFGRDIFRRVVHGTRISLAIGLATTILTGLSGTVIGVLAGFYRALDGIVMRCMDALNAFPSVMLAIGIAAALGAGPLNIVIALTAVYIPGTARLVRSSTLLLREADFVLAARALGAGPFRIIFVHILINILTPLLVQLTFVFAYAILAESALSFLGLGLPVPAPSLGNIISDGRDYLREAPWICLFPGLTLSLAVFSLNFLGDGLRDMLDPQLRVSP
jgi:peptide/nickel transport system permease protein